MGSSSQREFLEDPTFSPRRRLSIRGKDNNRGCVKTYRIGHISYKLEKGHFWLSFPLIMALIKKGHFGVTQNPKQSGKIGKNDPFLGYPPGDGKRGVLGQKGKIDVFSCFCLKKCVPENSCFFEYIK